jgi:hypothetical protein
MGPAGIRYEIDVALVSALRGLVAGRLYPGILPDDPVYPCIRYSLIGTGFHNTLCGQSDLFTFRNRVQVYARTSFEAVQIGASVKSVMRGFAYQNTPESEVTGFEPETRVHSNSLDFAVWAREREVV